MKGYRITFCQPVGLRKFHSLCQQIHTDRRPCSGPLANYKGKCAPGTQSSISPMPICSLKADLISAQMAGFLHILLMERSAATGHTRCF